MNSLASRNNIRGITIVIGGETTKLQKALREPEAAISKLQSELKTIENGLKFNPGNVELIGQKFEVVSGLVQETADKLKILEDAQAEVQRQFEAGEIGADQYRAFQRELETTRDKAKELADTASLIDTEFKRAATAAGQSMQQLGDKMIAAGKSLGKISAAIGGLGALSVKTFTSFDDSMRQVQATIGATAEEFDLLSAAAREAGQETRYTASDAADALNYLALAGYDVERSIDTLPKVLNLAAAGNLDLAYASDLVTDSMAALGLEASELDRFIDEMVRTSQRANTNVAQLGEAILVVGGQASLAGLNTNDLNTALGILADNGIKGSEGGTALRNALKNLYTPTDKAEAAMKALGVSTSTANGKLRDIQDVLLDLNAALSRLSEADRIETMSKIFDTRVIASANALLKDSGDRWNELSNEIANAEGAADEAAEILESGLGGALRRLKSAAEGAAISFGEAIAPMVDLVAKALTNLALAFANLPGPVQTVIAVVGTLLAVSAPLLILTGTLIKNVGILIESIPKIISGVKKFGGALKALSANPIVLVATAIAALVAIFVYLWNTCEEFRDFWIGLWEGLKEIVQTVGEAIVGFFTETIPNAFRSVVEFFQNAWETIKEFGGKIVSFFTETIPNAAKSLVDFFKQTPEQIGYALGQVIGQVIQFGKDLFENIQTAFSNAFESVKVFFVNMGQSFKQGFLNALDSVKNFVKEFPKQMVAAIKSVADRVVKFAKELPTNIKKALKSALDAVKQWGKDFIKAGIQSITDFVEGVVEKVKALPGELLQIGIDMIKGFIEGVKSMFTAAFNAVKDFFKGIINGIKDALGIHSPSKVFAEIGKNMAAGVGVGWADEIDNVQKTLSATVPLSASVQQSRNAAAQAPAVQNVTYNDNITVNGIQEVIDYLEIQKMLRLRSRAHGGA